MRSAHPGHKRGSIHRPDVNNAPLARRTRYPAPGAVDRNPPAIVERSKARRLIVYPCVTPGRNVGPVTVVIRRPARNPCPREPNHSVFARIAPSAVVVEIFIADNVVGNITGGNRAVFVTVAVGGPVIKIVVTSAKTFHVRVELVGAGETAGLPALKVVCRAASGLFSLAIADLNYGRLR